MKAISLDRVFITATKPVTGRRDPAAARLAAMPFDEAFDTLRALAADRIDGGDIDTAIRRQREALDAFNPDDESLDMIRAARLQILTALLIEKGEEDDARNNAALLLNLLAREPKRKDEPFLQVLAALLYDIAFLHAERFEFRQAERELEKALKIFERLAKNNPDRYGAAHILAQNAATSIYRSRVKQVNTLAHYQVATSTYLRMVNSGIEDATTRLVDSLYTEGQTLTRMGRHREAIQYYTRALKYITKLNPNFDRQQLTMSIDLGEALLNVPASREKGIHLLNTMLHKATKINAEEEHRRIVDILLNAKTRSRDILSLWHKIFPR